MNNPRPSRRSLIGLVLLVGAAAVASQWWAGRHERQLGQRVAALAQPGDIRMVSSEACPYCRAARHWFEANQVPFSECLIERDAACKADFEAAGSPGTPLMIVRGQRQLGFDPQRVADRLQPRAAG